MRSRGIRALAALLLAAAAAGLWHTQAASAAGVTVQVNASVSGQDVTLTADVLGLPSLDATGTVSFYEVGNASPLNAGTTIHLGGSVDDQSTSDSPLTVANVSTGSHSYYAAYTPSFGMGLTLGGFDPIPSTPMTVTVTASSPPPLFATQITLTSDATGPIDPTQTVTITAHVARNPASNGVPAGGTVAFSDIGSSGGGGGVPVINDPATDNGQKVPLDANGDATIRVQLPASPSPHEIVASYSGSTTDAYSTTAAPMQLTMQDANPVTTTTDVVVQPTSISAGDTVTITATIAVSGNAPTPPTGTVTFSATSSQNGTVSLPSVPLGTVMDADGNLSPSSATNVAVLEWPSWVAGDYTVIAAYSGNYPGSHGTGSLSVGPTRAATDLAYLGDTSVEYGHTATFSAKVTDRSRQGAPLVGRTVTFTLGSQACSGVSDSTGVASCALVDQQDVGTPGVTASVAQDLSTAAKSVQSAFSVTPQPTTLSASYTPGIGQATLSATLLGDLGSGVGGQSVTLTLGGETCSATTAADGSASCQVPAITDAASASLDASFAGSANGDYLASDAATRLVQLVVDTTVTYTGATTATYGGPATLSATLAQADGTRLANRTVTFVLGSQTCSGTTDAYGVATCTLPAVTEDAGDGTVAVSYAGDAVTNASSTSAAFTVTPAPTTTVAAAPALGTTSTVLSATLTSGGTPLAGRTLWLTLGGSTCTATTDANGVATCSVPTPAGASATFTASFAGETDYAASFDSRAVTLLTPTAITYLGATGADYSDAALVTARVLGADGHPVPDGETVTFTLGTKTCTGATFLGYAFCLLAVDEPAGTYTLTASYGGDSTYAASTTTAPFTVRLEEAVVRVTTGPALAGSTTTLSATLQQDSLLPIEGRTVTLSLGSRSCRAVTNASGAVSCPVTAPATLGPTTATATFAGDDHYVDDSDSTQAIVYAYAPGGGSFVVGDESASGDVTFWGAQWAKANSVSGGSAPSAFKGFALHGTTRCGTGWSTDPGNSAPPPAGPLPAYMAVLVTSGASKSGATISGNTVSIVVVRTDDGYAPNPGHAGTGAVVATVCGPANDVRSGDGSGAGSWNDGHGSWGEDRRNGHGGRR